MGSIANEQNFNDVQDAKINALNSLLNFANDNKIIEKDFYFDRESCNDRLLPASRNKPVNLNIWQKLIMFFISSK